ncbi:MAG: TlpA disulfide reductase family protein [Terracidiphilus sp.]
MSFFAALLFVSASAQGVTDKVTVTEGGRQAPAISVDEASGGRFSLAAQAGKVVVVNFWATWCEGCQIEMAEMEPKIWRKYQSAPDFAFIAIAVREDKDTILGFRTKHANITFPLAWDPKLSAYAQFDPIDISGNSFTFELPRMYVVDRRGIIVYQDCGYTTGGVDAVDRAIKRAMAEK